MSASNPPYLCFALTKFPTILILLTAAAYASPTVTVISPKVGTNAGAPVFYEAYATSPGCAAGIAAMRIYSAPGVSAFTVNGAHIEHFLNLDPGTYSTVVQAWDKCGGVSKTTVNLTVNSDAGVSVYLPNESSAHWPVHIAASAESPSCSKGIAAIRIYTAGGASLYDIHSNTLDAYVNLVPGTYDITVQAWDNCGQVYKSRLAEVVRAGSDAYLYGVINSQNIEEFKISSNGTLINPNGSGSPPTFSAPSADRLTVDPGGWFVYAVSDLGIYGFQINQSNGALVPIPGSPFPLNNTAAGPASEPTIIMDPTGNFVYLAYRGNGYSEAASLATYRIHRSGGSLTWTGWTRSFGNPEAGCYSDLQGLATNFTGQYLYLALSSCSTLPERTYGFVTDSNDGFLNTNVLGSPYQFAGVPASANDYLYLGTASANGANGEVLGASIDMSTGALTQMEDSPFFAGSPDLAIGAVWADWEGRFLWANEGFEQTDGLQAFVINPATGELTSSGALQLFPEASMNLVEDHSGQVVFTSVAPLVGNGSQVASWTISSKGTLNPLNTLTLPTNESLGSIAVVRRAPN
jgi:hypothetical protein